MLRFKFLSFGLRLARTIAPPHWCVCPLPLCLDRVEYAAGGIITPGGYPGTPRRYHHAWWLSRCTTEVSSCLVAIQVHHGGIITPGGYPEHHGGIITPGGYPGAPRRYHHTWWLYRNTTEVSSRLVAIQEHHGGIITSGGYIGAPRRYHHTWWISRNITEVSSRLVAI